MSSRTVVVTGGAAGIGRGAVERFVQAGDRGRRARPGRRRAGRARDGVRRLAASPSTSAIERRWRSGRAARSSSGSTRWSVPRASSGTGPWWTPCVGLRRGDGGQRRWGVLRLPGVRAVDPARRERRGGRVGPGVCGAEERRGVLDGQGRAAVARPGDGGGPRRRGDPGQRGLPGLGGHADAADVGRAVRRWTVDRRRGRGVGPVASARPGGDAGRSCRGDPFPRVPGRGVRDRGGREGRRRADRRAGRRTAGGRPK